MPDRKKILFLGTGGTISCGETPEGLAPELSAEALLKAAGRSNAGYDVKAVQVFSLDSTNMTPLHWQKLTDIIRENYEDFDGFVIAHGTDTMCYAAAALYCLVENSPKPVVLTGSQRSMTEPESDAPRNLREALDFAASDNAHGVHIVFCGRIISGSCAAKVHTWEFDAFRSINFPDSGKIADGRIEFSEPAPTEKLRFNRIAPDSVYLAKLVPGVPFTVPDISGLKTVILESYGAGGIPDSCEAEIARLRKNGIRVIVGTQVRYGGTELMRYEVGKAAAERYSLEETGLMTPEFAAMKAMCVPGNAENQK